jgi:cellulose synthase/poly-beta-1,6-N-acetylglucosamine synthase-like glycosyltransferase
LRLSTDGVLMLLTLLPLGLLAYSYLGYPALLWLFTRVARERSQSDAPAEWPAVSVVLAAFNEAPVIGARLQNLLSLNYPPDRLQVLVGSDGSTDETCARVRALSAAAVKLHDFPRRRGKASVVNDLVAAADGDVVVMTDANTFFQPDAVQELVAALQRFPAASAVVGELELLPGTSGKSVEGLYWRYETWLKRLESRFGCVLGANGAIYAFPRRRYQPLPSNAVVDDFLIPMLMQLRHGGKVFFVPRARAHESAPDELSVEFRRRVRIGAGDWQALFWTWRLLSPLRGMQALAYFSHKVLRWLGPWLLLLALVANLLLFAHPLIRWLLVGQLGFYALGILAGLLEPIPLLGRVAGAVRHFLTINAALWLGSFRFAFRLQRPFWTTARE